MPFIPFEPGAAHAKKQVVKGKPTMHLAGKHKKKSGKPDNRTSYNFFKGGYKGGKARTTDRMMKAAQRRLNM